MEYLSDDVLEQSGVIANCRMNRERGLLGSNGYAKELGFNPLDLLRQRVAASGRASWLDLCCGSGNALIEAACGVHREQLDGSVEIVGVDLAGMFSRPDPSVTCLRLVEASLTSWMPARLYDLITCVHGLHYIGDKLGLVARAASWLTDDGLFAGNVDLNNFRFQDGRPAGRSVVAKLRQHGFQYDRHKRLLHITGQKSVVLACKYLGADDQAGPNYTGQPAVNSFYDLVEPRI